MKINPYLNFPGNTEEAMKFYESVFGGKLSQIIRFKDMPGEGASVPKECEEMVMHVGLPIGGQTLMATDASEEMGFKVNFGNNSYISVHPDTKEEADKIFKALAEGGDVEQAIADQPWGDYWGSLKDKFGVLWMVNYHKEKQPK